MRSLQIFVLLLKVSKHHLTEIHLKLPSFMKSHKLIKLRLKEMINSQTAGLHLWRWNSQWEITNRFRGWCWEGAQGVLLGAAILASPSGSWLHGWSLCESPSNGKLKICMCLICFQKMFKNLNRHPLICHIHNSSWRKYSEDRILQLPQIFCHHSLEALPFFKSVSSAKVIEVIFQCTLFKGEVS